MTRPLNEPPPRPKNAKHPNPHNPPPRGGPERQQLGHAVPARRAANDSRYPTLSPSPALATATSPRCRGNIHHERQQRSHAVPPGAVGAPTQMGGLAFLHTGWGAEEAGMDEGLDARSPEHEPVQADAAREVAERAATGITPGRMPAVYLGHGAPPLVDDPLWVVQL